MNLSLEGAAFQHLKHLYLVAHSGEKFQQIFGHLPVVETVVLMGPKYTKLVLPTRLRALMRAKASI